jgi:hypothetical protein
MFVILLTSSALHAADWYVSTKGNDAADGRSAAKAFATVQRGVKALAPGDTLHIAPGEYHEAVRLEKFGSLDKPTTLRAQIPGTVLIRGDIPLSGFRKVEGMPYTWAVDFDPKVQVQTLIELDTRQILTAKPNARELGYVSGSFHQDRQAGTLYITSSDWEPAATHEFTASVIPQHGIALMNCTAVVIDGITVTGFNALGPVGENEAGGAAVGIYLDRTKACIVRDCKAYLNGCGIVVNTHVSRPEPADKAQATGDNLIERCEAWSNAAPAAVGNLGGLTLLEPRRDAIRDSISYLNHGYGVNIYGGQPAGGDPLNQSFMTDNLAWGNGEGDIKIKTGFTSIHRTERNVVGQSSIAHVESVANSLFLGETTPVNPDSIALTNESNLDVNAEFADPANHDYRLQSTSRFRGSGPDGKDRGPFPFAANVFFVRPDGNDEADGMSVKAAWRTLTHAAGRLKPGDTLYVEGGPWAGDLTLSARGEADRPITVRGRGREPVRIDGAVTLNDCRHLTLERLHVQGGLTLAKGQALTLKDLRGSHASAQQVDGLRVTGCEFAGGERAGLTLRQCSEVFLRGNTYQNRDHAAVDVDEAKSVLYSDYNRYANLPTAWRVGGQSSRAPSERALPRSQGASDARAEARAGLRVLTGPTVHAASATTANIEWMTSDAALCEIAWSAAGEAEQRLTLDVVRFGSFSLTGLKPGTQYQFRLLSLRAPSATPEQSTPLAVELPALSWTTAKTDAAPRVFHVAPDGDDRHDGLDATRAWRTLQRAADAVNVGDTVHIAPGTYGECVRMRATGAEHAPITFRVRPGARGPVILSGAQRAFKQGVVVTSKSHLRFDGLYLTDFDKMRSPREFYWNVERPAEFNLYRSRDIQITRCFSDGRGAAAPPMVLAWQVQDLLIRNCVVTGKNANLEVNQCPGFRLERSVMACTMINVIVLDNKPDQPAAMDSNIFTDNLHKKAALNIGIFAVESPQGLTMSNNAMYLRLFPVEERQVFYLVDHATRTGKGMTLPEFERQFGSTNTVIAEPAFAALTAFLAELDAVLAGKTTTDKNMAKRAALIREHQQKQPGMPAWWFPPEFLMNASLNLCYDFDGFFTTQPELRQRGIGLDPEAFADMKLAMIPGGFLAQERSR